MPLKQGQKDFESGDTIAFKKGEGVWGYNVEYHIESTKEAQKHDKQKKWTK